MKTTVLILLVALVALVAYCPTAFGAPPTKAPKPGDYKGLPKTAIPANAYGVFSSEDAAKEAAKKKKALGFMITDERADEPAVKAAGIKLFWAIEDDIVLVVLRLSTAGEWKRLPPPVSAVLNSPDLGKEFPKIVVANDDGSVLLGGMNSSAIIGMDAKKLDKFGKEMKKLNSSKAPSTEYPPPNPAPVKPATPTPPPAAPPGTTVKPAEKPDAPPGTPAKPGDAPPPAPPATATTPAPAPPPAATPPAPPVPAGPVVIKNAQPEDWTNTDGKTIQAALIEVNGDSITFEIGGSKVPYDLSKLSDASKKRVEELKASNSK